MFSESGKELTIEEQKELFNLVLSKRLLETTVDEWTAPRNEFVSLTIPKGVADFVAGTGRPDNMLSNIVTDLILQGISKIAIDQQGYAMITEKIQAIMQEDVTQQ